MRVKLVGNTAQDVPGGFKRGLKSVAESLRKTMTYGQGSAMARRETRSAQLKMGLYFCAAHRPWQRGCNQNTNGLIRQYRPKGMALSQLSHQQLSAIGPALNHRPRKILAFCSSPEVFSKLTSNLNAGVALQA